MQRLQGSKKGGWMKERILQKDKDGTHIPLFPAKIIIDMDCVNVRCSRAEAAYIGQKMKEIIESRSIRIKSFEFLR